MDDQATRDRVRALVREVLSKALPENAGDVQTQDNFSPRGRFIDTVPVKSPQQSATRDESSKGVITEDDVRGMEPGSVLRIAEGARLTPLAADIVSEKRIEIVTRSVRRGSKAARLVAVGTLWLVPLQMARLTSG